MHSKNIIQINFLKNYMKKIIFSAAFFLVISCVEVVENIGCGVPTYDERETAKSLYNPLFSTKVSLDYDEARKVFGCQYERGDLIYTYSRFYDSGYLLMHDGQITTYRKVE